MARGKASNHKKQAAKSENEDDQCSSSSSLAFHPTLPKPSAITTNLFMWDHVASFCLPRTVMEIERVSRDVHAVMQTSNTGTNLMQRYWNAMVIRLVWENNGAERLTPEKLALHPKCISRSEGKQNWKRLYQQQYEEWVEVVKKELLVGTPTGGVSSPVGDGVSSCTISFAPVQKSRHLTGEERANKHLTGEELSKMELSAEESYVKAMGKRKVAQASAEKPGARDKKLVKDNERMQKLTTSFLSGDERAQYKLNPSAADRRGKHKKGGMKKWAEVSDPPG